MEFKFNILKLKVIIYGAMMILFGLIFCLVPTKAISIVEIMVASIFMVYGLLVLFGYCFSPRMLREPIMLAESILFIGLGLLLDFFPFLFVSGISVIIFLFGCKHMILAVKYKFHRDKNWWVDLVMGLIVALLGLVSIILSGTKVQTNIISVFFGISMIINGVTCYVLLFALKRFNRKVKKVTSIYYGEEGRE